MSDIADETSKMLMSDVMTLTTKVVGPSSSVQIKPDILAAGFVHPVLVRRGLVAHPRTTAASTLEAVSQ